ncbi:energy-dependent translational throttle protein EttA, partial [Pseudomonadales bacterium]|nr:energy-dependent translational throttle protein EttA [Pseudomonadales bacterium]
ASRDVRGNVEDGVRELKDLIDAFNEISDKFAEPMSDTEMTDLLDQQGELQLKIDAADGWDLERKLNIAADALRLPPFDADVTTLSGGEKRRVALCRLLMSNPDMLLLDEPTNHLDAESVAWLEHYLQDFPGTVVAITHDRYFLDNAAGWILELDRGYGIPFEGNYSAWLEDKDRRLEMEDKREGARQKTIKAELEWVRTQPKARHAKNRARLARFEELNGQEFQRRNETLELYIPPGPRLGDVILEVEHVSKGYGDQLLIDDLSFSVPKGAIVGIIGGNGAGKSTLFRMISGTDQPDNGTVRLGETVVLGHVDQSRDSLSDDKNVWEEISEGNEVIQIGRYETPSRGYVSRFNFKGGDQQKLVKNLSGGERNRVHLAKLLKKGANFLLLDEPTNDLDVETLRSLETAIEAYPGTLMVISHDRWFLDRIATHILAFEGNSTAVWFDGNYSEYEEDHRKRQGDKGPTRVKYKKLA